MSRNLIGAALAVALIAVFGWPLLATILAASPLAAETLRVVLAAEALALPIGLPLALVLFRTDLWGRRPLLFVMGIGAFVPMPLYAAAWLGAFGNAGRMQAIAGRPILVGWFGAAFVHAMAAIPWIVLLAGVGLRTVEPELEEAALLDRPAWRVLVGVTLRRGLGAIAGAALAVAVLTAGDMTVTDLLQVRTYAEESYTQFQLGHGPGAAAAVALPPLILLGGLVVVAAWGLLRADPARLATVAASGKTWRLGRWRIPLGIAVLATSGNLAALPLYTLIWWAGRVGGDAATGRGPRWSLTGLAGTLRMAATESVGPLLTSLFWASFGATVTVVLAWALAWSSRRPGAWRWVVAGSVALALATPGPVAGMALVLAYRAVPFVYDVAAILVLAAVLRTLPYVLLVLWPAVRSIPPEHFETAELDGWGTWGQIRRVALPMTRAALIAGWCVAFVLALGELPATNLVAPPGTMPITVVLFILLHTGVESHLAGVALVMLSAIAAAALVAIGALRLLGSRSAAGPR